MKAPSFVGVMLVSVLISGACSAASAPPPTAAPAQKAPAAEKAAAPAAEKASAAARH